MGCGCVTTCTLIMVELALGRRFSTGGRVLRHRKLPELRAGARRQRRRGALHPHAEGESVVGAELRDDRGIRSAWPCSSSSGRTTSSGCWRSTTTEARPRCDATSSGWTRRRRSEYRQTRGLSKNPGHGVDQVAVDGEHHMRWRADVSRLMAPVAAPAAQPGDDTADRYRSKRGGPRGAADEGDEIPAARGALGSEPGPESR